MPMTKSPQELAKDAVRKYVSLLADFTLPVAAEVLLERLICSYLPEWPTEAEVNEILKMNDTKFSAGYHAGIAHCRQRQQRAITKGPDLENVDDTL